MISSFHFITRKNNRTMRRSTLIGFALIVAHCSFTQVKAQSDDFGVWAEANIEKKLNRDLTLDAGVELRTRDDVGELDRWSAGVGLSYKLTDWLKAALSYTLLDDNNHKVNSSGKKYSDYWGQRHRVSVSLTFSKTIGNLSISLRERWQYTYRPETTADRYWNYTDEDDDRYYGEPVVKSGITETHTYRGKGSNKWRRRMQLKYKLTKTWRPYINAESVVGDSGFDKMRYSLGTEIRFTKQHWLDVKYLYQHSFSDDDDEGNRHVIGLGYTYKF